MSAASDLLHVAPKDAPTLEHFGAVDFFLADLASCRYEVPRDHLVVRQARPNHRVDAGILADKLILKFGVFGSEKKGLVREVAFSTKNPDEIVHVFTAGSCRFLTDNGEKEY